MKTLKFTLLLLFITINNYGQIKSPTDFFGYEFGSRFTRHSNVVHYFKHLAANSSQVKFENYGEK